MRAYAASLSRHGLALGILCGLLAPAWAAQDARSYAPAHPASAAAAPLFVFDIPAQPLHAALNQYADISGQPALFPSDIVGERSSTAVRGRYSAEQALRLLLQGSGLMADKRSSGLGHTFILQEIGTVPTAPRSDMAALFHEPGYAGLVQRRVWQALCADARVRPGDYSALLRFHLAADGRIGGARLIGSSGDARRDAALLQALQRVRIDRAPPAALARWPLTMVVAPTAADAGPQCEQEAG